MDFVILFQNIKQRDIFWELLKIEYTYFMNYCMNLWIPCIISFFGRTNLLWKLVLWFIYCVLKSNTIYVTLMNSFIIYFEVYTLLTIKCTVWVGRFFFTNLKLHKQRKQAILLDISQHKFFYWMNRQRLVDKHWILHISLI